MPELPEVETTVRDLGRAGLPGVRIVRARIHWNRSIACPSPARFVRTIRGLEIQALARRGKFAILELARGFHLLVHLRMSGRLQVGPAAAPSGARRHDRVVLTLADGRELRFTDPRKFGRMWLVPDPSAVLGKLGPEPLEISAAEFSARLGARRRRLKPLLLDQAFLAGIGNIYADEALWTARLHPRRGSDSLRPAERARLRHAIQTVLRRGIRNLGTTLGGGGTHFVLPRGERGRNQEKLNAYGQTGLPCPRCGTKIRRIVVGQRSTHLCPRCQPAARSDNDYCVLRK